MEGKSSVGSIEVEVVVEVVRNKITSSNQTTLLYSCDVIFRIPVEKMAKNGMNWNEGDFYVHFLFIDCCLYFPSSDVEQFFEMVFWNESCVLSCLVELKTENNLSSVFMVYGINVLGGIFVSWFCVWSDNIYTVLNDFHLQYFKFYSNTLWVIFLENV